MLSLIADGENTRRKSSVPRGKRYDAHNQETSSEEVQGRYLQGLIRAYEELSDLVQP
ncbi:hypothetical protein [Pseudomonas coleopterorum]|uniref:hypothetical protein n=1 Tax=Pseudomonas coleopterorum TaxID=1605838 RepID=UPI001FC9EF4C|nr:hypothetical protein [Pseudomonas coleopterorum]